MAQRISVDSPPALSVAPVLSRSLGIGLVAGLAILVAVYAGLGIAFLRAMSPPAVVLSVAQTEGPVAIDMPIVLQTIGWDTRVDEVRLTEFALDPDGKVLGLAEVPVVYNVITEGRLPGESRGRVVRPDGSSPLSYDAHYELLVRGEGQGWGLSGPQKSPLVAAAAFRTPSSPRPEYPTNPTIPRGEALAIGWNVPITSMEYRVEPAAASRVWLNEERDIAYIVLEDPAQGTQYSVEITGAQATSGAPMHTGGTAAFMTPPALKVVSFTPQNGSRDIDPVADPVIVFSAPIANPELAAEVIRIEPPIDGEFRWLAANRVQFVTEKGFPNSTDVELSLRPGPEALRSVEGGYLDEAEAFGYRTRPRKQIDVDLTRQQVTLLEDGAVVYRTTASTGVRGAETPTGNFKIQYKMAKTRMRGVNPSGQRYDIPDVPWVMAIYDDYALHGAPWRQAWGTPQSNGCVSMPTPNAKFVYDWTPVGTPIYIHY